MSKQYDEYLKQHRGNVAKAYNWIYENLPELINPYEDYTKICDSHDSSKYLPDEYEAYDRYFYGVNGFINRSSVVVENFNRAWLQHIHRNPHHWQHWVLNCDDPDEGEIILSMPYYNILEMICDWWSFAFTKGDLEELFDWYGEHSSYIKLHKDTREVVEKILAAIKEKLSEEKEANE